MALRINGNITGTVSNPKGNLSGSLTTGTYVNGTSNGYTKEEIDNLLQGKSDVDHEHEDYTRKGEFEVYKTQTNETITSMSSHLTALDNADNTIRNELDGKATITYVANAINNALGTIEASLDEIIGEEV